MKRESVVTEAQLEEAVAAAQNVFLATYGPVFGLNQFDLLELYWKAINAQAEQEDRLKEDIRTQLRFLGLAPN